MISFGERCYSNQYDEISDDEFSDDEISGFANTRKFLTTKFPTTKFLATKFPPPLVQVARVKKEHKNSQLFDHFEFFLIQICRKIKYILFHTL